jgi:two-component system sensor histidine kinase TctE
VVLDAGVSYYVALHYANLAYDRWLLDSTRSLAQVVKAHQGKVTFEPSPAALEIFRWDEVDKTFFKIQSQRTGFIAGDKTVPNPPDPVAAREQPCYFDSTIQGRKVRVAAMLLAPSDSTEEVLVEVAETLNKRHSMTQDILLAVILPQLLLVLITGLHIWVGVNRGLQPLHALTREIAQRSSRDMTPVADSQVPQEVLSLTHTINDLLRRLALAMAAHRRFIENAAHQLRTPLAGLKVQADRALRAQDFAAMQPALIQIKSGADRLAHLSTQLLVLARSEPAMEGIRQFSPVDLGALSRETCMEWVPGALERDMDLSFEGPDKPARILGDPVLLRELLSNLLDNAVHYGRTQGQITVRLKAAPRPVLTVEDDGPGIPESERGKIFERFYRIPGSPGDGCGLGLAIVKEIADLHSASIEIGSGDSGQGTRIEVAFETVKTKNVL